MKKNWLICFVLIFLSSNVWAQEAPAEAPKAETTSTTPPPPPPKEWEANAGVNAIISTGNSENESFGGNGLFSRKWDKNKLETSGNGAYGRATDSTGAKTTNTKNWRFQQRYDRYITDPVSLFGLGRMGQDPISGIDWRYGGATGVAHEIWKTDPDFFKYEVGFDYTRELRDPPPDVNLYSIRLFLQYKRKFSEWGTFGQDVESLFNVQDGEGVRLNTLTAVTMKMTDVLALQVGFNVRFDNQPVVGKKKTDTTTTLGLVVNFL